jgi:hypothetical protein
MVEVAVATLARVGVDDAEVIVVNDGRPIRRRDAHGDWAGVPPPRRAHVWLRIRDTDGDSD